MQQAGTAHDNKPSNQRIITSLASLNGSVCLACGPTMRNGWHGVASYGTEPIIRVDPSFTVSGKVVYAHTHPFRGQRWAHVRRKARVPRKRAAEGSKREQAEQVRAATPKGDHFFIEPWGYSDGSQTCGIRFFGPMKQNCILISSSLRVTSLP